MHQWFVYLFDERKDEKGFVRCFECGKKMHEDTYKHLTTCYSHILDKSLWEEYKGKEWNVQICHPNCHHLYTMKPSSAIKQYQLRLELLEKHKNGEL